jgi:hypothetical protein
MKNRFALSFLVLSAAFGGQAMAGDVVVGAVVGGGVGAAVGNSIGGRDGAVVGGMLGAMTGVMMASDKHDHREGYAHKVYHARPRVIYQPATVVVRERTRVVVNAHPDYGHAHGYGHGHWQRQHHYKHHQWHGNHRHFPNRGHANNGHAHYDYND